MHRYHVTFLLVFLSTVETIFGGKCEIVRFVNENNIARKCCVLNKKVAERHLEDFRNQGYFVLQDNQVISICRNVEEEKVDESTTKKVEIKSRGGDDGDKDEKKIPTFDIHQFIDSSKRCPDGTVLDFKNNCVDPFV